MDDSDVDFIKIGVRGWEFEMVKEMMRLWTSNRRLSAYFEFWIFGPRRAGGNPIDLLGFFRQHGFDVRDCFGWELRSIGDYPSFCSGFERFSEATNLLAIRLAAHQMGAAIRSDSANL